MFDRTAYRAAVALANVSEASELCSHGRAMSAVLVRWCVL